MTEAISDLPTERRIIVATDARNTAKLTFFTNHFAHIVGAIGIKPEVDGLDTEAYMKAARKIRDDGAKLFVDANINRVPYDIGSAVNMQFTQFRANTITVSAAVGERGFAAAAEARDIINHALAQRSSDPPKRRIYVASIPPDYTREECQRLYRRDPEELAADVTQWAINANLDGISCGSWQAAAARETRATLGSPQFDIVVSGIRRASDMCGERDLTGTKKDVCSAYEAVLLGADYLLVGKTLTSQHNRDCNAAFAEIVAGIEKADVELGRGSADAVYGL